MCNRHLILSSVVESNILFIKAKLYLYSFAPTHSRRYGRRYRPDPRYSLYLCSQCVYIVHKCYCRPVNTIVKLADK